MVVRCQTPPTSQTETHLSQEFLTNPDQNLLLKLEKAKHLAALLSQPTSNTVETLNDVVKYSATASSPQELQQNVTSLEQSYYGNRIIALDNMGSTIVGTLHPKLLTMIMWEYFSTIEVTDPNMDQLKLLLDLIQEVRLSLADDINITDKVKFAHRFLEESKCQSFEELEETLLSHRAFRENLSCHAQDFRSKTDKPEVFSSKKSDTDTLMQQLSLGDQIISREETSEHRETGQMSACSKVEMESSSSPNVLQLDFKPFLGDSSVRPKEKKHKPVKEISRSKDTAKARQTVKSPEPIGQTETTMSPETIKNLKTPSSPETLRFMEKSGHSETPKHVTTGYLEIPGSLEKTDHPEISKTSHADTSSFEQKLELMIKEAQETDDKDYVVILSGIKHNFELSDLIHSFFSLPLDVANLTRRDGQDSATESQQEHTFFSDSTHRTLETQLLLPTYEPTAAFLNESSATKSALGGAQVDDDPLSLPTHFETPDQNVYAIAISASSSSFVTWQSRIRTYFKNIMLNKPLVERLGQRPKVPELKDKNCPNCGDRYRWPHLLHCCHRFCFPCVTKLFEESRQCFKCPICDCLTTPLSTQFGPLVLSLKIDSSFAREMFEANMSPFCCTLCFSGEDALKFCKHCLVYLCFDCCLLHCKTESTSGHQLENSDMKVGAKPDGELCPMCRAHPGNFITRFCSTCRIAVCDICCNGDHSSHDVLELENAIAGVRETINSNNAELIEIKNAHQRALMNLNLSKQRLDSLHRSERHKITEMSNYLLEQIETLRKRAIFVSEATADVINTQAVAAVNEIEQFHRNLLNFRDFVSRYINSSNDEDMLSVYPVIKTRYLDFLQYYKSHPVLRLGFSADLRFDPKYPEVTSSIHETFSSLRFQYSCLLAHMLSSPLVRERHHVEPYRPLPYSLDYRYQSEIADREARERQQIAIGASSDDPDGVALQNFFRTTLPYSRAFGRYGRGEYEFAEPSGVLYLRDRSLAVCDTRNHRIVVYHEDGTYQRTIGQPRNIPDLPAVAEEVDRTFQRTAGKLYFPYRMAQCPKTKNIVVVERPPSLDIQIFTFDGQFLRCFGNNVLQNPRGITVDEKGLILILESKTMNFFIFTQEGELIHKSVLGTLEFPNDVAARRGTIYISDNRHHCVKCFDYSLNFQKTIGNESFTYYPISVGFNHLEQLVVSDNHNTFNITVFECDNPFVYGFKSRAKHANCYNVSLHPTRRELAVTTKECQVLIFTYEELSAKEHGAAQ